MFCGVSFGTVVALPLSGLLVDALGWQSVFYVTGGVGLVWFVGWMFLCYDSPETHPRISEDERSMIVAALERNNTVGNGKK